MKKKQVKKRNQEVHLQLLKEMSARCKENMDEGNALFNEANYHLTSKDKETEFDKVYRGMPSEFDDIDFGELYGKSKLNKYNREKDKEIEIINQSYEEEFLTSSDRRDTDISINESLEGITIHAVARSVEKNEGEKVDKAILIAEDFVKRDHIKRVGGALYIYNGRFYELLPEDNAQKMIFRRYREDIGRANPLTTLRSVAALLRYCAEEDIFEFPLKDKIIVFNNGTLEIDTERFRENSPKDCASSALGINYSPNHLEMPYTKRFLQMIADGDVDLYERMLQAIGYMLSNDIKAKSFFYLEGVGNAGKSRFCDLVASFYPASGANAVSRIALQDLGGKFSLGNLVNRKLNISEDLPDSPISVTTVSRIKMISDGNCLEAEAKYVQAFSFRPTCKLLFASNHPLKLKEYDEAFINRVVYIPFVNAIPKHKQDRNILEKMKGELPALFNHAFKAYKRLVASGYSWAGAEKFKPQIEVAGSEISCIKESVLREFVEQCCVIDEESVIASADLQDAYEKYCRMHNYSPILGDRFSRELKQVLPETVVRIKIGNQRRGFKGVRVLESYPSGKFQGVD